LSLNAMQEATRDSIDSFKASISDLQARTEVLNRQQGEHVGSIKEMADSVARALQHTQQLVTDLGATTDVLNGTLAKLGQITTQFGQTARTLDTSSETLKAATDVFQTENATLTKNYRDLFEKLDDSMEMAELVVSDYAEKFGVIQEGLKGIFDEIDTGLKGYQTVTRESLNTYLADFADKLHAASNALSGSVEALDENLSDLNDHLEDFARRNGHT